MDPSHTLKMLNANRWNRRCCASDFYKQFEPIEFEGYQLPSSVATIHSLITTTTFHVYL